MELNAVMVSLGTQIGWELPVFISEKHKNHTELEKIICMK